MPHQVEPRVSMTRCVTLRRVIPTLRPLLQHLTIASTCRQSMNQEHSMHSFTFLCASFPPVHSQSACPVATPENPRGREYTDVQLPPPLFSSTCHPFRCYTTHSVQVTQTSKTRTLAAPFVIADTSYDAHLVISIS